MLCDVEWLRELVRMVPDFPEPGIRFADITPLLGNADALRCAVELLSDEFVGRDIAPIACRLGCGFAPIRKPGRLPADTHRVDYTLEYGSGSLEIHQDAASAGQSVLLIDDVLATGGTAGAAIDLIEMTGATVSAVGFLASIEGLDGSAQLRGHDPVTVLGAI